MRKEMRKNPQAKKLATENVARVEGRWCASASDTVVPRDFLEKREEEGRSGVRRCDSRFGARGVQAAPRTSVGDRDSNAPERMRLHVAKAALVQAGIRAQRQGRTARVWLRPPKGWS